MYIYDDADGLSDGTLGAPSLVDELTQHIADRGSADAEARIDEERRKLRRALVLIAENHSATTRSADLARRLLENDAYRYVASESFLNAGRFRIEIREFMRGARTSLSPEICANAKLLQHLMNKPRFMLFAGSRAGSNRDPRLAQHFIEEIADRKLQRTTPGILICGINHGARVVRGTSKTMRRRLEDLGVPVLGLRLVTDDFDRAECRINKRLFRTDTVFPVGEAQTDANAIRLLDLLTTTAEYTVVPTRSSPFERVTDDPVGNGSSPLSIAKRYELVVLAKRMPERCRPDPCSDLRN